MTVRQPITRLAKKKAAARRALAETLPVPAPPPTPPPPPPPPDEDRAA